MGKSGKREERVATRLVRLMLLKTFMGWFSASFSMMECSKKETRDSLGRLSSTFKTLVGCY